MIIVPTILETDSQDFTRKLSAVAGFADRIQLDFDDGTFGGTITVLPELVAPVISSFASQVNFEAHLMVQKPFNYIPKLIESGVKNVILQAEVSANLRDLIDQLSLEEVTIGLSLGPATEITDIEPFLDLIDLVNILTVPPGKQGQPFLAAMLHKVTDLRNLNFTGEIEVDGGLDEVTLKSLDGFAVDTLVVGHTIVNAPNPSAAYFALSDLAKAIEPPKGTGLED